MVINPEVGYHDSPMDALWYAVPYFEQIRDYIRGKGISTTYLYRDRAVKDVVWYNLSRAKHTFIIGVGHGNNTTYTGYQVRRIFYVGMEDDGYDFTWTRGTVFLLLSCLTANQLGPYMVHNAAWSYLGWDIEFGFYLRYGVRKGTDWRNSPELLWHKPIEEAFARCATGEYSPEDAYNYIYRKYTEYILNPEIPVRYKELLRVDRDHMKLIGMRTRPPNVTPPTPVPPPPPILKAITP